MVTEIHSGRCGRDLAGRGDGGLRVQRVEDRLDQQQVDAALGQRRDLLRVRRLDLVEGDRAVGRVLDLAATATGSRSAGRPSRRRTGRRPRRRPAGPAGRRAGSSRAPALQAVVGLADAGRGERVGGGDVGAGGQVLPVHVEDDVRPGQVEQVRVAGDVLRVVGEAGRRDSRPASAWRPAASCPRRRRAPAPACVEEPCATEP